VAAVPALVKLCGDDGPVARLAAVRALEWLARVSDAAPALRAAAPALAAQLAAEQGRAELLRVNEELRRLQWRLSRL
jgi:hypothetical protein